MTIKQAKKLLGKLADNISDKELEQEIKTSELLKTLYFSSILSNNNSTNDKA